jgi:sugar phosphate isomerase/epimerase
MSDQTPSLESRLVASPCCLPRHSLDDLYPAYRRLGFAKFEGFSSWAAAAFDWKSNPAPVRARAREEGFEITSFHLPPLTDEGEKSFEEALSAARFAAALGAKVALFKARKREHFRTWGRRFLDAVEAENLGLAVALQNHKGSSISTLDDYREVFALLENDPRLKAVLEVGHFQRLGIPWHRGWALLADRITLIHVNEIREGRSVHFGTGEVDFAGLMERVKTSGYSGDIVVELELDNAAPEETLEGLAAARRLLCSLYERSL